MAGPPLVWPLFSSALSPTSGSARYGAPAPTSGLTQPDGAERQPARRTGPAEVIAFKPRSRRAHGSRPHHPTQTAEVKTMSHLSRSSHDRVTARERRFATLIWASFLVFVFVAGIASRIWLR